MTTIVANGGSTNESIVRLQITLDAPLLSGDLIEVLRTGQVLLGVPTPSGSLTYQYIDEPGIGQHSYAVRVSRGQSSTLSAAYRITLVAPPPPPPAALFLDTFDYSDLNGGAAVWARGPEIGSWINSADESLLVNNGIAFAADTFAGAQTEFLTALSGAYTLKLDFSVGESASADGNFTLALTDSNIASSLQANIQLVYQAGVGESIQLNVGNGTDISYSSTTNFSGIVAETVHTLTIEIAPNYYNFKFDGVNLGMFGPYTQGADGLVNPQAQIFIYDGLAPTANTFTFTKLVVTDGMTFPLD